MLFFTDIRCDRLRDPANGHFECEDYEELTPDKTCTLVCDRDYLPSGLVESLCFNWTDAGDNVKYNWTVQQEEFNCYPQVSYLATPRFKVLGFLMIGITMLPPHGLRILGI